MSSVFSEKIEETFWIRLNRPNKKNAINQEMYTIMTEKLMEADADPEIVYTILTGEGDFYSSGSDFSSRTFSSIMNQPMPISIDNTSRFIDVLIAHSKILVALVNGPAIGIGCTMLAICDYVIASEKAYFWCPFTELGLIPECASSVSFAALMGYQPAARLALFGEKIDAAEAHRLGLVSRVVADGGCPVEFQCQAAEVLNAWRSKLAPHALLQAKAVTRSAAAKQKLHNANRNEIVVLKRLWEREETAGRIAGRFSKRQGGASKI